MKTIIYSFLLLFLLSCSKVEEKSILPEEVSPEVYKVLMDNEDVKVLEVTFEPGQSDKLHNHNVMTFHVIQGGKVQVTLPDGTINEREFLNGATGHRKTKTTHQVKNIGENTVKVLIVEHKKIKPETK